MPTLKDYMQPHCNIRSDSSVSQKVANSKAKRLCKLRALLQLHFNGNTLPPADGAPNQRWSVINSLRYSLTTKVDQFNSFYQLKMRGGSGLRQLVGPNVAP